MLVMNELKPPYLMSREEWYSEKEKTAIRHGQLNYTKSSKSEEIARIARLEFLLFGVGKWIYDKACNGEEWALDILEYQIYDRYEMVIRKATDEGLLPNKNNI
jgi:hypothetical protein